MSERVTVLGTGLMGSTLAVALADAGHLVTVWNRTREKAAPLDTHSRIAVAGSAAAAVSASSTTILSLSNYDAASEVFAEVAGEGTWQGHLVANLVSGTPDAAVRFGERAESAGARYLDGMIPAYPREIGLPGTAIFYSGDREVWDRSAPVLSALGGASRLLSQSIGAANAFEVLLSSYYTVALAGFLQGAAYADAAGLSIEELREGIGYLTRLLGESVDEASEAIERDDFSGEQSTVEGFLAAIQIHRGGMRREGMGAALLGALEADLEHARDLGHGADGFSVLFKTSRMTSPGPADGA